jgi:hypothetical protein
MYESTYVWYNSKRLTTEILDGKYEKTDVVEVMKGLIHLDAHQKADLPWVLYLRTKRCLMKLLTFTHIRRYTLTLTQFYALPSTLNPFEDFQKGVWPSCWTWCLSTTTIEWMRMTTREGMDIMLIHHPKEGQQSMLDKQLTSTEQSQKM